MFCVASWSFGVRGMLPNRVMETISLHRLAFWSHDLANTCFRELQWSSLQRKNQLLVSERDLVLDVQDGKLGIEHFGTVTCMGSYT